MNRIKTFLPYVIIIFGIIINIFMWHRYYMPLNELYGDADYYNKIAQTISKGSVILENGSDIGSIIMPGYPAVISAIYFIFAQKVDAVYLLQILACIIACLLVYLIMKYHTNEWFAFFASVWILAYYPLWRMNLTVMKESLTASLFIFSIFFILRFEKYNKNRDFIIFSILWALLITVMNRFIVHFTFITVFFIYLWYVKKYDIKYTLIFVGIVLILLLPWHIRQYIKFNEIVLFSPKRTEILSVSKNNNNQFKSYEEYKKTILESGFSEKRKKNFENLFNEEIFQTMKADYNAFKGVNKYWSRLKGFFEIYNSKLRFGFGGDIRITPPPSKIRKYTDILFLTPMFVFTVVGIFFIFKKRNYLFIILAISILAHILLHTYVGYMHRYRLTILPAIFMIGWYGIYNTYLEFNNLYKRKNIE